MNAEPALRIDGRVPPSAETVAAVAAVCDEAEERGTREPVVVHVSGAPSGPWTDGLTVRLVTKWERVLRRFERLPVATIALADGGDCGGAALDALLASDYRVATDSVRLVMPASGGVLWPGMALYRLAQYASPGAIRRTVLFGAPLTASEALAIRVLDEITDDVRAAAAAPMTGLDVALRRQLMFDAAVTGFEEALGAHLAACDRVLRENGQEAGA